MMSLRRGGPAFKARSVSSTAATAAVSSAAPGSRHSCGPVRRPTPSGNPDRVPESSSRRKRGGRNSPAASRPRCLPPAWRSRRPARCCRRRCGIDSPPTRFRPPHDTPPAYPTRTSTETGSAAGQSRTRCRCSGPDRRNGPSEGADVELCRLTAGLRQTG